MLVSATLPPTVYAEDKQALMTRVVEIFLALDCVLLSALFYNMWKQQRTEPDSAVLPEVWLAQEGGSCEPALPETTDSKANSAEWGVAVLEGEALPLLMFVHPVDSPERILARQGAEGRVDRVLLGASEEQPEPTMSAMRVGTSMPRPARSREPRSLVGAAV